MQDFEDLIALEESLDTLLSSDHEVDGHDFGSGQMNIFVITDDPVGAFGKAKSAVGPGDLSKLRAAYRPIDGEEYVTVWPEGSSEEFSIL